ncbi:MAG: hypothetical protein GY805_37840 [Chloroflexi bacterium]|nr:hypothetical protein [Chloroflexota bacterium]
MHNTIAYDGAAGLIAAFFLFAGIAAFVISFVSEAILLRLMEWGSWLYATITSFIMNLASTIAGFVLASFGLDALNDSGDWIMALIATWFLSFLIEGLILKIMRRNSGAPSIWSISALVNIVSYVLIIIGFAIYIS